MITEGLLRMIGDAETFLSGKGFAGCRVRHHGNIARIEIRREDFPKMLDPETSADISRELKRIGYLYVTLDLEGYVQGSMNRKTASG
jgi:uncharacterized protein